MFNSRAPKLVANPMVVAQAMPEGAVLVNTESGNCFELNRTGAEIWEFMARNEDPATIADAMIDRYGLERSEFSADLERLMSDLARHGILIVAR
jgi:hypothetical protein